MRQEAIAKAEGHSESPRHSKPQIVLLAVLAVIATVWFLRETSSVTIPLAAAVFVTMLVYPVYAWLRRRVPKRIDWLALVLTMLLILAALALIGGAVAVAVDLASEHVPQYAEKLRTQWQQFASWAGGHGLPVKGGVSADGAMRDRLVGWLTGGLRSAWAVLTLLVLVLFFVALMLLEAPRWCEKVEASMRGSRAHATLDTTASVASQVRQYLLVRTMLGAVTAVLNGLWLWAMGVDLALVWAMLFFVLNYIPTIGSIVAAVPPALVALAGLGPGRALVVIAGLLVIEQFMGNFVDPRWVGRRLSLSPLVVLVAVVFWGWVWGVAGALLAVPMTATIVVACAHVPSLRPLALLLSRTGSMEQMARRTHSDGDAA